MNIAVIGAGYVGLVTGACFAELGNHVTCIDVDEQKIKNLQQGIVPIYEPGLDAMIASNAAQDRLHFAMNLNEMSMLPNIIFIAVGTPSDETGLADTKYVLRAAEHIGASLNDYCVVVDKSTVPVGMADQVAAVIQRELDKRVSPIVFDVASNPEFLREGNAIDDFMQPDRVIVGLDSARAKQILLDLYVPILRHPERLYFMNIKDAEMTKYAANAMLATRISFVNEIALLCEKMGADIEQVRIGMGSDARIGPAFLQAGCGYGGSCFPKDIRALIKMSEQHGVDPLVLNAVEVRNHLQKQFLFNKIKQIFGEDLSQIKLAIWGLSFKPGTDDMREAPSLVLIEEAMQHGAHMMAYDPVAMPHARQIFPQTWLASNQLVLCDHQYDALKEADALILVTEWKPFCYPDLAMMKHLMRRHLVIDGRNQYDPKQLRAAGFEYYGVGRG
ncbi:MAG: UDP-glucose 6-dehydrogenase [Gammaproteobacteria bacterium RIFCSPHIGHO2_12_FULL_42_10]|nr:MAG: UDP-glucose 6-dehydrogenase [Gammaproteobacteria bacterium RIFCSPHIGHO2_12_FULL_42_10]